MLIALAGTVLAAAQVPGCAPPPIAPQTVYAREVEGNVFDTTPVHGEYMPLRLRRTEFEYRCSECHADIESPARQNELTGEHAAIYAEFSHGLNTNCLNCHHRANRDAFVDRESNEISAENPALLCAQCHGTIYRDWEAGIHGRLNGYWNEELGPQTRLLCAQCHDPHSPKFPLIQPDPPPIRSRLDTRTGSEGAH